MPALIENDGTVLFESLAILEYLDETHPNPPLLPKEPKARARVRGIAQIIACDTHPLIVPRVREYLAARIQDRRGRRDEVGPPLAHQVAHRAGDQSRRLQGDRTNSRRATSSPSPTSACAGRRWARPTSRPIWRRSRPSSASSRSATRSTRSRAPIRSSSRARPLQHDQHRDRRPRLVGQESGEGGARLRRAAALYARRHARARQRARFRRRAWHRASRASTRCWPTATSRR